MVDHPRLGGFNVRDGVAWASLACEPCEALFPLRLTRLLAREKVNLPFFSYGAKGTSCTVDIAMERRRWNLAFELIADNFKVRKLNVEKRSLIASVFPHGRNPWVGAKVLRAVHAAGVDRYAAAQSNSAFSVLISEEKLPALAEALFTNFRFQTYPTVADWKLRRTWLAVPKEIVASYQEKRPKVYSLDLQEGMDLLRINSSPGSTGAAAEALEKFALTGENTGFFCGGPPRTALTLATTSGGLREATPALIIERHRPVAVFTMNGPHFGDRYGIAAELMNALKQEDIELLALTCTMASVTGIIPQHQVPRAIKAITACFEVPLVNKEQTRG
jgi:aspartokinase